MPKHNKNQYTLQEVYRWYSKRVETPISYKDHKKVLDTWGDVVNEFLLSGKDVKLAQGMSILGIRKKEKRTYVDRKASKIEGKLVVKQNSHSGFYGASVYWRRHYTTINSKGWVFRPTRELARALADVMVKPLGHTRFVKRARVARTVQQSKSIQRKTIHKI